MSFRKEYKVRLNHYGSYQLKLKLYNLGMKKLYRNSKVINWFFWMVVLGLNFKNVALKWMQHGVGHLLYKHKF